MERDRDYLFEQRISDYNYLRELYRSGSFGGLNKYERELLEFCHNTDMPKYLKENVGDKPIVLNEDGSVNWAETRFSGQQRAYIPSQPQQQMYYPQQYQTRPMMPQVDERKFFYLYDDNGNLIAAIPQK